MLKKLTLFLSLIAFSLASCAQARSPGLSDTASSAPQEAFVQEMALEIDARGQSSAPGFAADIPEARRMVIKNANLSIAVDDPSQSMQRLSRMAEEMGGFVVSANLYQTRLDSGAEVPRASLTIRVPAERLAEALERIKTETQLPVINENISSQDVTLEYTDLQSRLRNLEAAEEQLMRIMDGATETEDVLNVYSQLTQVREQIEVLKGQIQYYDQSVALSAISVELIPNAAVQPLSIGGWQSVGVAREALQSLINALQFLATAAIWIVLFLLPTLLVALLPPALIIRGLLRWRARRIARAQAKPSASSE